MSSVRTTTVDIGDVGVHEAEILNVLPIKLPVFIHRYSWIPGGRDKLRSFNTSTYLIDRVGRIADQRFRIHHGPPITPSTLFEDRVGSREGQDLSWSFNKAACFIGDLGWVTAGRAPSWSSNSTVRFIHSSGRILERSETINVFQYRRAPYL